MRNMAERLAEMDRREVPHDEEKKALKAFLAGLRKKGWKKLEVEAAHSGWEWAFDTGYDQDCDEDAARDMADCVIMDEEKKWAKFGGKDGCADLVFTGISAARDLQETEESKREREAAKLKMREEILKSRVVQP